MTTAVASSGYGWSGTRWTSRGLDLLRRRPELLTAAVCAVVLAVGQRGPDLPAQAYRVSLVRHHGLAFRGKACTNPVNVRGMACGSCWIPGSYTPCTGLKPLI